jgi:general secretion pathway protein H
MSVSRTGRRVAPAGSLRAGFTLMELLVAMAIAGMVLAVAVPSSAKFYDSLQYRAAVKDVVASLTAARHAAVDTGAAQDVAINPVTNEVFLLGKRKQLPEKLSIEVRSARQLNKESLGIIRFYPEGGSSGGGVDITHPAGGGVSISVDWLVGTVSQQRYAVN